VDGCDECLVCGSIVTYQAFACPGVCRYCQGRTFSAEEVAGRVRKAVRAESAACFSLAEKTLGLIAARRGLKGLGR
jgi:hypothetical protein